MTKTYSLDLRSRVINYLNNGHEQKDAAVIFSVSKSTVNRWWLRYIKEGIYQPKERKGSAPKIDRKLLEEYVNKKPNTNLKEIGSAFKVTAHSIHRRLKELGFSYKKKPLPTWKRAQKNELNI